MDAPFNVSSLVRATNIFTYYHDLVLDYKVRCQAGPVIAICGSVNVFCSSFLLTISEMITTLFPLILVIHWLLSFKGLLGDLELRKFK